MNQGNNLFWLFQLLWLPGRVAETNRSQNHRRRRTTVLATWQGNRPRWALSNVHQSHKGICLSTVHMKPGESQRHCGWVLILIQVYWLGNQPRRHSDPGVTHLPIRITILVGYPGQHNSKSTALLLPLCFSPQSIVWIQEQVYWPQGTSLLPKMMSPGTLLFPHF